MTDNELEIWLDLRFLDIRSHFKMGGVRLKHIYDDTKSTLSEDLRKFGICNSYRDLMYLLNNDRKRSLHRREALYHYLTSKVNFNWEIKYNKKRKKIIDKLDNILKNKQ